MQLRWCLNLTAFVIPTQKSGFEHEIERREHKFAMKVQKIIFMKINAQGNLSPDNNPLTITAMQECGWQHQAAFVEHPTAL